MPLGAFKTALLGAAGGGGSLGTPAMDYLGRVQSTNYGSLSLTGIPTTYDDLLVFTGQGNGHQIGTNAQKWTTSSGNPYGVNSYNGRYYQGSSGSDINYGGGGGVNQVRSGYASSMMYSIAYIKNYSKTATSTGNQKAVISLQHGFNGSQIQHGLYGGLDGNSSATITQIDSYDSTGWAANYPGSFITVYGIRRGDGS
tara:strand:+ start:21 stop:614 length:594 start_codon:yes stop_codon:yes gene_type:complete